MSPACGPIVSTQPKTTSSTMSGSIRFRSTIRLRTWRAEVGGMDAGEAPLLPPQGSADGVDDVGFWHGTGSLRVRFYCLTTTEEPWPKRPWFAVTPGACALDLSAAGLAADLPGELADLRDRLGGDRLSEAREAAARIHGNAAAQGRRPVVQQRLAPPGLAEADVLVPVELERGREVVDLGEVHVLGTEPRLLVGGARDRIPERRLGHAHRAGRVGREVRASR